MKTKGDKKKDEQEMLKSPALIMPSHHKGPQVFTDEELSEIFQIDFAEIFGSPDEQLRTQSSYKGVQLPQKTRDSSLNNSKG